MRWIFKTQCIDNFVSNKQRIVWQVDSFITIFSSACKLPWYSCDCVSLYLYHLITKTTILFTVMFVHNFPLFPINICIVSIVLFRWNADNSGLERRVSVKHVNTFQLDTITKILFQAPNRSMMSVYSLLFSKK